MGNENQKEVECDDINSGSAVVFVAHGEGEGGVEGNGEEARGTKGGGGEKSQEEGKGDSQ